MSTLNCSLPALLPGHLNAEQDIELLTQRLLCRDLCRNALSLRLFVVAMASFSVTISRAYVPSETHNSRLHVLSKPYND
jgi:hypothetical protein